MTRTTAIAALLLLLLASRASAQDSEVQPAPVNPNAQAIPLAEQVPQPLPTLVGTSAQPVAPETPAEPEPEAEAAPQQPPPTLEPNTALDVPTTIVTQPVPRPTPPPLTLTVDRAVVRRGEPFTFTVRSPPADQSELARMTIQVTITRGEPTFRTLRIARNGTARTVLPLGNYQAYAFASLPIDMRAAFTSLRPRISNQLSLRVVEPRADAPVEEPAPPPEPQKPTVAEPVPEQKPAPEQKAAPVAPELPVQPRALADKRSTTWPWLLIAIGAAALLALVITVQRVRGRKSSRELRARDESDDAPKAPRLTAKTHLAHETTLLTAPRLRFRISARAIPDKGKQHILPPSTPAPKLEETDDRRADHP